MSFSTSTNWKDDEEISDEEEEYDEKFVAKKFSSVLIIDNSLKMFEIVEDDEDDNSYFKMCLVSILNSLHKILFRRFHRNISVIFMYEKEDVLIDFNDNLTDSIKKLNQLKYKTNDELKDLYGCKDNKGMCVHESMHTAVKLFKKNDRLFKNSHKHVAILTNESSPEHDDKCTVTIEEMVMFNVELVVLPLVDDFKWTDFYFDVLKQVKENEPVEIDELGDEGYVDEDLLYVIERLIQTNTNVLRTIFRYGDNSFFNVQVKKFVDVKKLYHRVRVNPEDGQRASKQTLSEETSDEYRPYLSKEDIEKRSRISLPVGITLLYVSNRRSTIHHLQHNQFLMMEDDQVEREGSNILFDYFYEFCFDKNKVFMCTYNKGYVKQKHYLIELRPDRYRGKPCFIGQFMCYSDSARNFRPYASKTINHIEPDVLDTACDLIKRLTVRSDKAMHFSDPKFDFKASMIKGHLLSDRNAPWKESDEKAPQFPSVEDVTERIGEDLIDAFRITCLPQGELKRKRGK